MPIKEVLLAPPFILVLAVTPTVLMLMFPPTVILAAAVPLILVWGTSAFRPLLTACLFGNGLMLFGSAGEVEFLGRLIVAPETTVAAVLFSNSLAIVIFLMSKRHRRATAQTEPSHIPTSLHIALLALAALLLVTRFTGGIPVLQGDSGRLSGLLTTNPYLGLFSGVLPIAAAFLSSRKSNVVFALKVLVAVLVIGTASRLLLGAVLIGFISSSRFVRGGLSGKTKLYLALSGIGTILAVTKIYSARTAEGIQKIYESRISEIGGFPGWVSDVIGPSLFYAARNGLVIHELIWLFAVEGVVEGRRLVRG
ncbi:hypothetical protein [Pseudarthrobacter oxydans]|uniref:hypothetical protein n=1 Tax=Pseudarthrobacter oxydans TaxID=1671 RepID=UPI00341ADA1E